MMFQALSANLPRYTTVRIPFPGRSRDRKSRLRHQIVFSSAPPKNVRDRDRIIGNFRRQVADMKIQEMRPVPSPPWPQPSPRWNACSGPPEVAFFIDRLTPHSRLGAPFSHCRHSLRPAEVDVAVSKGGFGPAYSAHRLIRIAFEFTCTHRSYFVCIAPEAAICRIGIVPR